ncbi:DUF6415 family natural product biosynthesis protein [Streptomyces sp. LP11]|uniref:DUF6415 family natural product biosynthesis protein n=1 Tax=Streptomyces pyxinicus TaxID=2970331 RepID=A0ABT2B169_9ACTN|nr:DUF6415 family natural product biosynthesis protein [Streptomyces sp. LP11]MCS0602192.1 DUF6415 family natural product biosynthesis protein [Streptomyces sp. LP11]
MTGIAQASVVTSLVDTDTMRGSIALLLPHDAVQPPTGEELATLTTGLRGHVMSLIPQVERLAAQLPEDDVPRYCAKACIDAARGKLASHIGTGSGTEVAYARRLARVLGALCDHYEALTAQRVCVACGREIRATDITVPYDRVSASGGTITSPVHAACAPRPYLAR